MKVFGSEDIKRFPVVSYGTVIIHGIIGAIYYALEDSDSLEGARKIFTMLQLAIPLPFITCEAWLAYGYRKEYAWLHCLGAIIPILQWLADSEKQEFIDLMVTVESISLGYVCFMAENWVGVGAACMYVFNHFFRAKAEDALDLPGEDIYNYGLAIFCFLSLYAIGKRS